MSDKSYIYNPINMAYLYTQGLPDGTHKETKYEFNLSEGNLRAGEVTLVYSLYIPGNYIGRDQIGEPTYPEQVAWLNSLSPQYNIKEVWYGCWEIVGAEAYTALVDLLNSCK